MNVTHINPFIRSTREVFDTMVHVPIQLGRPALKDPDGRTHKLFKISASIGLSGAASGLVVLSFSEPVALTLASALAGERFGFLGPDAFDALAEIANMITGSAKRDFPGGLVSITVPTLLPTESVVYPADRPVISIPFDTPAGRFLIEVSLRPDDRRRPTGPSQAAADADA